MTKTKVGLFVLGHREWKTDQINVLFYLYCGATAQRGSQPPHA
jgi:hypothetical protein